MKKFLTITLLTILTIGLFISCNPNSVELLFDNSYKIQSDGSWAMGSKVYPKSTKPYILVVPKTVDLSKGIQLEDLDSGLKTLEEIRSRSSEGPVEIENATVQLKYDDFGNEYYEYINKGDELKAQNIFMRTTDWDFTETILLNAPHDEFSHYGSLNVATVGKTAQNSYYEYGRVRKVVLSIGHLVAETASQIDMIIVDTNEPSKASVDIKTTAVKGIIAPEGVVISKPASVTSVKTEDAKFMDADGKFYSTFTDTQGDKVTLLGKVEDLPIDRDVEIDMFGNKISGQVTIAEGSQVIFSDSTGGGALDNKPEGEGTFEIASGNYGFNPTSYLEDEENTEAKEIEGNKGYYKVGKKDSNPEPVQEIPEDMLCFTAVEADASVTLKKYGSPDAVSLVYSVNGGKWENYEIDTVITATDVGDKVYFRAENTNTTFSKSTEDYYNFVLSKKMSCSGNIMYLLDSTGQSKTLQGLDYVFYQLFAGDYSNPTLTSAPALPATTLAVGCYMRMFYCTALTTAPVLPATTMVDECYRGLFSYSTLTTVPELPATTLAKYCYDQMFSGCKGLTSLPEGLLPVTELADSCYHAMFQGCEKLNSIPADLLPATVLKSHCYNEMFANNKELTTAPTLSAPILVEGCYDAMFSGCTKLTSVTMLATTIPSNCLTNWLNNTASTGTFVKGKSASISRGVSGIPNGWTVVENGPLCFVAVEAGATVKLTKIGSPNDIALVYSTDGSTWTDYEIDTVITATDVGDKVYFKAKTSNAAFWTDYGDYYQFVIPEKMSCEGNIMYLLDSAGQLKTVSEYSFYSLFAGTQITTAPDLSATTLADSCYESMFSGCTSLTTAPVLPAMTLADCCYLNMFSDCTSLTTAPALPATTLADSCYEGMFSGCTALTTAPALPATTLADSCYEGMFSGCTSLTTSPALPATTLTDSCYESMFSGCTLLTTAPALPATTLADECYGGMFQGCASLTTSPALPATTLADECYESMFSDCTSLTDAPALPATTLTDSCYESMFSGCTSLTTAPVLSATTLADECYGGMFYGCTSLSSVTMLATDCSANHCLNSWLDRVADAGTLIIAKEMKSVIDNDDDDFRPEGWTVVCPISYTEQAVTLAAQDNLTFTVTLDSSLNGYSIKSVSADGTVVKSASYNDFTIKYSVNSSTQARTGYITVTIGKDGSSDYTEEIPVKQIAPTLTLKAVYDTTDSKNTLTFYYDSDDHSGTNKTVWTNIPTSASGDSAWPYDSVRGSIKEVVIDSSVSAYAGFKSTNWMFANMKNASIISGTDYLDVSNVTTMQYMFYYFGSAESANLDSVPNVSGWDTSKVTNMDYMFANYGQLSTSLSKVPDVSEWYTSSVTSMNYMFASYGYNSSSLTQVPDVSKWNTSKVISMNKLFNGYGSQSGNLNFVLDLSDWNVSQVTSCDEVFVLAGLSGKDWKVSIPAKTGSLENDEYNWHTYDDRTPCIKPLEGKTFNLVDKSLGALLRTYAQGFPDGSERAWLYDNNKKYPCYIKDGNSLCVKTPDQPHQELNFSLDSRYSTSNTVYSIKNGEYTLKLTVESDSLTKVEIEYDIDTYEYKPWSPN